MKPNNIITTVILAAALLSSCREDARLPSPGTPVTFTTHTTRAENNQWQDGDRLGITMERYGRAINYNCAYRASPEGLLTAEDTEILFPDDNSKVDFKAYHPYVETHNDWIDIHPGTDYLYSDNATGRTAAQGGVMLKFNHIMAKLEVEVEREAGVEGQLKMKIRSSQSARFNIRSGRLRPSSRQSVHEFNGTTYLIPGRRAQLTVTCGKHSRTMRLRSSQIRAGEPIRVKLTLKKRKR